MLAKDCKPTKATPKCHHKANQSCQTIKINLARAFLG